MAPMAYMFPGNWVPPSRIRLGISPTVSEPSVPRNPHTHVFPLLLAKEV